MAKETTPKDLENQQQKSDSDACHIGNNNYIERLFRPRVGLFLVERTSGKKPCDEAFEVELMEVERQKFNELYNEQPLMYSRGLAIENYHNALRWRQRGTRHRIENGMLVRDIDWQRKWAVHVNDFMDFVDKHGQCIVYRNMDGFATIEIYDDYRE